MNVLRRLALAAVLLLGALPFVAAAQGMTPEQRDALNAAERWLVPVDGARYADAWAMAAGSLKGEVDRNRFRDGMRDLRKEYGGVVKRKPEKIAFLGDAPPPKPEEGSVAPGAQISILFDTKFVRNRDATEEVTVELEKDGLWRVAGYHLR